MCYANKASRAHGLIRAAIKNGVVVKPNKCERCGSTRKIEGHHPSYDEPLKVIWLCMKCHRSLNCKYPGGSERLCFYIQKSMANELKLKGIDLSKCASDAFMKATERLA